MSSVYRINAASILQGRHLRIYIISIVVNLPASIPQLIDQIAFKDYRMTILELWERYPFWNLFRLLIALVVYPIVSYAIQKLYIEVAEGGEPDIGDLYADTFREGPMRMIVHSFLTNLVVLLWSLLLIIPGIMATYSYSMGYYLLNLEPYLGPVEAMKKSRILMNGNRLDLFLLDFSYIGWYFLCILTLGIALIWVAPRHQTARAAFFSDIYNARNAKPEHGWINRNDEKTREAIEEARLS